MTRVADASLHELRMLQEVINRQTSSLCPGVFANAVLGWCFNAMIGDHW